MIVNFGVKDKYKNDINIKNNYWDGVKTDLPTSVSIDFVCSETYKIIKI